MDTTNARYERLLRIFRYSEHGYFDVSSSESSTVAHPPPVVVTHRTD